MKVFDNLLTETETQEVKDSIINADFPFYLGYAGSSLGTGTVSPEIVAEHGYDSNVNDQMYFVHDVVRYDTVLKQTTVNSKIDELLINTLNKLIDHIGADSYNIYRTKINLSPQYPRPEGTYCVPHRDLKRKHVVVIYYVNDSDGPTYLFEDDGRTIIKIVEPKQGRFFMFDGSIKHAGSHPIKNKFRVAVNYNIEIDYGI